MLKSMLTKREQKIVTGIRILYVLIKKHINGWEKEFNENDGYLKANFRINLYSMRKAVDFLNKKFELEAISETYRDQFIQEAKDTHLLNKKEENEIVKNDNQRYLPYNEFITDFYITGVILDLISEKYDPTVKKMGIDKEFDKIIKNYNTYTKFFEKEIVIM